MDRIAKAERVSDIVDAIRIAEETGYCYWGSSHNAVMCPRLVIFIEKTSAQAEGILNPISVHDAADIDLEDFAEHRPEHWNSTNLRFERYYKITGGKRVTIPRTEILNRHGDPLGYTLYSMVMVKTPSIREIMDVDLSDWSSSQFEQFYDRCIIDEQAIQGEGDWKNFYKKYKFRSGVYRIICEIPYVENGVKYDVIYIGQSGTRVDNSSAGIGWRTTCYIDTPRNNDHDTDILKRVQSLVKGKNHGRIILECLKTESNEIIEAMLLRIHEFHDSVPLKNEEVPDPSIMKPRDPNCRLYHLVADNYLKYC